MPNMPWSDFGVGEDVAVEGPDAELGRFDDHLEALAGGDVERVADVGLRQEVAVLGDDQLRHPVQVHRVDHHALVHVADEHASRPAWRRAAGWPGSSCR